MRVVLGQLPSLSLSGQAAFPMLTLHQVHQCSLYCPCTCPPEDYGLHWRKGHADEYDEVGVHKNNQLAQEDTSPEDGASLQQCRYPIHHTQDGVSVLRFRQWQRPDALGPMATPSLQL